MKRFLAPLAIIVAALFFVWRVDAAITSWQDAIFKAAKTTGDAVTGTDVGFAAYGSTGTVWTPVKVNSSGIVITTDGCTPGNVTAVSISSSSTTVPAAAVSNQQSLCLRNQSTTQSIFCEFNNSTATTAGSWEIGATEWYCTDTSTVAQCVVAAGTASVLAYGCGD